MPATFYSLHLRFTDVGTEIKMLMRLPMVIGRSDPTTGFKPDIDLEDHGGAEGGVSRRHALLIPDQDTFVIKDLNSTNGSLLNGVEMKPHVMYAIKPGDELTLGHLNIRVGYTRFQDAVTKPREDASTLEVKQLSRHETQSDGVLNQPKREAFTPAQQAAIKILRSIVINRQISDNMVAYIAAKATQEAEWTRNRRLAVLKTACEYGYVARDNAELMREQRRVNEMQFGARE
jgi:pSer/pThr/pTyr-binding forkhead associated (FHA) protein